MTEKYSIEDILAEFESRRNEHPELTDNQIYFSLTQELQSIRDKARGEESEKNQSKEQVFHELPDFSDIMNRKQATSNIHTTLDGKPHEASPETTSPQKQALSKAYDSLKAQAENSQNNSDDNIFADAEILENKIPNEKNTYLKNINVTQILDFKNNSTKNPLKSQNPLTGTIADKRNPSFGFSERADLNTDSSPKEQSIYKLKNKKHNHIHSISLSESVFAKDNSLELSERAKKNRHEFETARKNAASLNNPHDTDIYSEPDKQMPKLTNGESDDKAASDNKSVMKKAKAFFEQTMPLPDITDSKSATKKAPLKNEKAVSKKTKGFFEQTKPLPATTDGEMSIQNTPSKGEKTIRKKPKGFFEQTNSLTDIEESESVIKNTPAEAKKVDSKKPKSFFEQTGQTIKMPDSKPTDIVPGRNKKNDKELFFDQTKRLPDIDNAELKRKSQTDNYASEQGDKTVGYSPIKEIVRGTNYATPENKVKHSDSGADNTELKRYLPFLSTHSKNNKQKSKKKSNNVFFEKAKPVPRPILEDINNISENKTNPDISPYRGKPPQFSLDESSDLPLDGQKNKNEDTDNMEVFDDRFKPPSFEQSGILQDIKDNDKTQVVSMLPQDSTELRALKDRSTLKKDKESDHPSDIIESINPYDVRKKAHEDLIEHAIIAENLSGDTQGIAGEDLKEIAEKAAVQNLGFASTEEVGIKSYVPSFEAQKPEPEYSESPKSERTNVALIKSLNKAIKERRKSETFVNKSFPVSTKNDLAIPQGSNVLNIDYKKQVLKDTTLLPVTQDPIVSQEKIQELNSKRKRKIKDFVLEERDDSIPEQSEDDIDRGDDYDTYTQIWSLLRDSHNGLKLRFMILLVLTAFMVIITACNDFGVHLAYRVMGFEIRFLDHRFDTTAYIIMQLIVGLLGLASCGAVLIDGFRNLFRRHGDCDSICAVSSVMSVIGTIALLFSPESVRTAQAHIYISVGLCALLFNTIGKLQMINCAKSNFRFVSGDSVKYYADLIKDDELARAFTKGSLNELPVLCTLRKTEFLSDFLKSSYCTDLADNISRMLTPIAVSVSFLIGIIAFFFPNVEAQNNFGWAVTACVGALSAFSSFSVMLAVHNPFRRASKALTKYDSVILGYGAAMDFADVNSVLIDANAIFPPGSVAFSNIKRCQNKNSLNTIAIDEAIIIAASLAIKSNSILSSMFYDMIAGKSEMLYDVESCIYEVNMGITGWIGNRRIMLGNREQMKHHSIKVPDRKVERKYCTGDGDVIYLAVSGEAVAMFFFEIVPNPEIKVCLQELDFNGISIAIRTRDSLVTVNKVSDVFDINPERVKILPFNLHEKFDECTRYTSRGKGDISCDGTFTSLAMALVSAKKLIKSISLSATTILTSSFLALILATIFMLFGVTDMLSASAVTIYNLIWLLAMLIIQLFKKYD